MWNREDINRGRLMWPKMRRSRDRDGGDPGLLQDVPQLARLRLLSGSGRIELQVDVPSKIEGRAIRRKHSRKAVEHGARVTRRKVQGKEAVANNGREIVGEWKGYLSLLTKNGVILTCYTCRH